MHAHFGPHLRVAERKAETMKERNLARVHCPPQCGRWRSVRTRPLFLIAFLIVVVVKNFEKNIRHTLDSF